MRITRVVLLAFFAHATVAQAQQSTPTSCDVGSAPPCTVVWTVPSRYVDPERALVHAGEPNSVDGVYEEGLLRRRSDELKLMVHLPTGYDGEQRFPVLYLLHGSGGHHQVWTLFHKVEPLLRDVPAVVVMPEGGSNGFYANWWDGGRTAEPQLAWERYHLEEVIPLVEDTLKIRAGRRWRAIFGFSMGGNGAIRYAAQCGGCFGTAGSLSGGLDLQDPSLTANCAGQTAIDTVALGPQAAQDPFCFDTFGNPLTAEFYWAGHNPLQLTSNLRHVRVYVAHGDGVELDPMHMRDNLCLPCEAQFAQMAERFVAAARADGVTVEHRTREGGHVPVRAKDDLEEAIKDWGIFERVETTGDRWTFKTVSQQGRMWDLGYEFDEPPDELVAFERDGRMLRGKGSGTVSIRANDGKAFTVDLPFEVTLPTGAG